MTEEGAPPPFDPTDADRNTEIWRSILMGTDPSLPALRRRFRRLPSDPRCKMCAAPFRGPGRLLTRLMMHGPSESNPMLCSLCFGQLRSGGPGGAEIEISVLLCRHPGLDRDRRADVGGRVSAARPAVLPPGGEGDPPARWDRRQVPRRRDHGVVHPGDLG